MPDACETLCFMRIVRTFKRLPRQELLTFVQAAKKHSQKAQTRFAQTARFLFISHLALMKKF